MNRIGLAVSAVAVAVSLGGCGGATPPVPQWKEPLSSPTVTVPDARPLVSESAGQPAAAGPFSPPEVPSGEPSESANRAEPFSGAGFVEAVREELPETTTDLRNEEITEMGSQACDSLAAGNPRRTVVEALGEFGLTPPDARELVTLARSTLCRS